MTSFDAIVVADPRFSGGTSSAMAADVSAMSDLGLSVGLMFVRSGYLHDDRDPANPRAMALRDLPGVTTLSNGATVRAPIAFLHHPMVFSHGIEERASLAADRAVMIAHHPPFRGDGSLEYDPIHALRNARTALGLSAWVAPVSPMVRAQMAGFAPLLQQTSEDWPNVFDVDGWQSIRPILAGGPVTIGRHGRPDPLKFPMDGAEIDAGLPAGPDIRVRVLGCPAEALRARGAHPDRWDVLSFGAEPVIAFLNSLDIFVYHYHPAWQEAFGRTVVEAALCGRPCLLDPRLKATFGDMAAYCAPHEVADAIGRIAADPGSAKAQAERTRMEMVARYGTRSVAGRIARLREDEGDPSRRGRATPPLTLMRKMAGHHRRRLIGAGG